MEPKENYDYNAVMQRLTNLQMADELYQTKLQLEHAAVQRYVMVVRAMREEARKQASKRFPFATPKVLRRKPKCPAASKTRPKRFFDTSCRKKLVFD